MPKATAQHTPSRRAMLACVASLPIMGAGAAESPDAALILACDEFCRLETILTADGHDSPARDAAYNAQGVALDRITALAPAHTPEGVQALTGALRAYAPDLFDIDEGGAWDERLLSCLLRSITKEI